MPDLENHWFTERLAYLGRSLSRDTVLGQKVSDVFPRFKSNPKAEGRCKLARECRKDLRNLPGSSDISRSREEVYQELVVGSALDPLVERFGRLMEEIRSHWNGALG